MHQYDEIRHGATFTTRLSRWLFVGVLASSVGTVAAGEIYKSVDANGNVVYSDHVDPTTSGTTAIRLVEPTYLPHELHVCWTNCFTLALDHGVYHRADGTDETWTVETFSTQAFVLHRHDAPADWNGHSPDVVYAGQVACRRSQGVDSELFRENQPHHNDPLGARQAIDVARTAAHLVMRLIASFSDPAAPA